MKYLLMLYNIEICLDICWRCLHYAWIQFDTVWQCMVNYSQMAWK